MLNKRAVLLSKDETAYNTDSVPVVGTDAILVEDLKWGFASTRMHQRKPARASLGMFKPLYGGTLISVSFKAEIKGSGSLGVAPEIGPLLRSSGWAETISGGVSVTYKPNSTQSTHKSESMYFYDDGLLLKITGARGKCSFDFAVGGVGMASFDFTGHFVSVTDIALPSATYDSTVPPVLVNVPFTVAAFAAVINKLAFDLGVEVALPESIAATDGFGEVQIVGRNPTGSFNPLRVTVASRNFIADFQAGTAMALDTGVIGVATNRYQITMPAITYTMVDRGEQANIGTYENKFAAAESAGDDEISMVFT